MAPSSGLSRRLRWGIADQALSSLTSLLLAVVVARSVGVRSFGVFGVALSGYVLAVLASRAVVGEPLGIRYSGSAPDAGRRALAGASGTALVLGVCFAAVTLVTAMLVGAPLGWPLAALAVSLPGLVLQDAWRYGFVAVGQPAKAMVNDLILAITQGTVIAWLIVGGDPPVAALILAWGGAATVAAAVGCLQAGVVPVPSLASDWLTRHRDLWPRLLAESAAMAGTWQLTIVLIGAVAGLETIGALRGAQTLLGPLNLAFLAVPLVALPELARLGDRRRKAVIRASAAIGAGLGMLSLLGGLVVWAIPDRLGHQLLGPTLQPARTVLLPYTVFLASTGVNIAAIVGLRSIGAADRSLRVRLGMAPVLLSAGILGAAVNGSVGAAVGLASANWLAAGAWWWQLIGHSDGERRTDAVVSRLAASARVGSRRARRSTHWRQATRVAQSACAVMNRVPLPVAAKKRLARLRLHPGIAVVPMDRLLMGGENAMSAADYAVAVGDRLRPSTPIDQWPHVELLRSYVADGAAVLDPERFETTSYLHNARQCIALTGHYFGARDDEGIREVATDFVRRFAGLPTDRPRPSQSSQSDPVRVRPVLHSTCFEVVDGHHRLAARMVQGERDAHVVVERRRVWTPLQSLFREMSWLDGRLQLYQPVGSPDLEQWPQLRRCTDRRDKMLGFLAEQSMAGEGRTYLDVASCYGWFVAQMGDAGFDAYGMERDPLGAVVAEEVYGVEPGRIAVGDAVALLEETRETYAVVSCFSLLHHFVLGRGSCSAERLVELLDQVTGSVLFVDTGQSHEAWFRQEMPEWDPDFIEAWLRRHTSFDEIVRLGPDDDAVPPFEKNYGRMLFACVRHPKG